MKGISASKIIKSAGAPGEILPPGKPSNRQDLMSWSLSVCPNLLIDYEKVVGLLVVMFQVRLRQLRPFQKVDVYFLRLGVCGRMILRLLPQNSRHQ